MSSLAIDNSLIIDTINFVDTEGKEGWHGAIAIGLPHYVGGLKNKQSNNNNNNNSNYYYYYYYLFIYYLLFIIYYLTTTTNSAHVITLLENWL